MFKKEVLDRFLRYAVIDTMSDPDKAETIHPSTEGQWDLLKLLEKELREMGISDIELDAHGYLLARIPANKEGLEALAFNAHVDTSSDVEGNHVNPQVIEKYDGNDIVLSNGLVIKKDDNPELKQYEGTTIVTSDGTSLLGCDDKGGVAEIMTAVSFVMTHPEVKHGEIEILFSPDEETGYGLSFFDPSKLHCTGFYTVDGGERFVVETECFNAATVRVSFEGVSYHLGSARGRMVNAVTLASAFINMLPQAESPEATDNRFGYYCPFSVTGGITSSEVVLMLRDFDYDNLKRRIETVKSIARTVEQVYPGSKANVLDKITYLNMAEASKKNPKAVDLLFKAGKELGQPLREEIIRGGTDGARIAESGIPTPNIYDGGHNFHSLFEWAAVDCMNDSVNLIVEIIRQWAK